MDGGRGATVARRRERAEGATEARGWGDTVGQDRARERFPLDLSGEGRHLVPGTARIDRPDAAVVSVVVVAVRGFVMRARFRVRGWRAESRWNDEDARVAHAPRRVLIIAVTLSHVELPLACRAGTTERTEGQRRSESSHRRAAHFQKWKSPRVENAKVRAFRSENVGSLPPSDFPTRGGDALVGEAVRRAALAGRLFRLCSPVALQLAHDMGVATTMSACGASSCSWLVCLCVPWARTDLRGRCVVAQTSSISCV